MENSERIMLVETNERSKANEKSIEEIKNEIKEIRQENKAIVELAYSVKSIAKDMGSIKDDISDVRVRVSDIEQKPYKEFAEYKKEAKKSLISNVVRISITVFIAVIGTLITMSLIK